MQTWMHSVLSDEKIALDTCKMLVCQGREFIVEKIDSGGLFMVRVK